MALQPGRTTDPVLLRWADFGGAEPGAAFVAADLVRGGERLGRAIVHPPSIAGVALVRPALQASVREADGAAAVEIAAGAGAPALAVWLDAEGLAGRFDDNFFDLLPGERRSVRFLADGRVAPKTLAARLRVRTLADARP